MSVQASQLRKIAEIFREAAADEARREKTANVAHTARAALGLKRLQTSMGMPQHQRDDHDDT